MKVYGKFNDVVIPYLVIITEGYNRVIQVQTKSVSVTRRSLNSHRGIPSLSIFTVTVQNKIDLRYIRTKV